MDQKSFDGYPLCMTINLDLRAVIVLDLVPRAIAPATGVQLTWILFLEQVHTKHLVLGF